MNESSIVTNRIHYIDQLRAWNVLLMCYTHSLDSMLADGYKSGFFYQIVNFFEGIMAPSFLFVSGAAFSIVLSRRKEGYLYYGKPAQKQFLRLLFILLIAYWLHLPYRTWHQCQTIATYDQLLFFFKTNNLQVIAFGILISQILFVIIRNEKIFHYFGLGFSIILLGLTPIVYQYDFAQIFPLYIATYFNSMYGSIFPLFPWISYFFIGSFVMYQFLIAVQENREYQLIKKLLCFSIIAIFIFALLHIFGIKTTPYYDFWYTSPNLFIIRLSCVVLFIVFFWYLGKRFNYRMKIFGVFRNESLLVYVLHLLIIYGSVLSYGLAKNFGQTLNWFEIFLIGSGIAIVLLIIARQWNWLKREHKRLSKTILLVIWLCFAIYFFTQPF
jgi:uncharacterized membrane protein